MNLDFYRETMQAHGVGATLCHAAYRAANQITRVAVWDALAVTRGAVAPSYVSDPRRRLGRLLEAEQMRRYTSDSANRLTAEFVTAAAHKGDRCFALLDGDTLMSYGWYSTQSTTLTEVSPTLTLHFDPSYVYMYNGFTLPRYRGRRLYAVGMAAALDAYALAGRKGLVSYVEASNFSSLKACQRMGYTTFGHVALLWVGRRFMCRSSSGCDAYGFRVEQTAD